MSISSRLVHPDRGETDLEDLDEPTIEIFEGVLTQPRAEKEKEKPKPPEAKPIPEPVAQEKTKPSPPPKPVAAEEKPKPPRPRSKTPAQVPLEIPAFTEATGPVGDGVSNEADLASARELFADLARVHVSQVRDVMLELRYGDVATSWVASSKATLTSLRSMATQMELVELVGAIDEFCAAIDRSVAGAASVSDERKTELMAHYERLAKLIPQAFALDGERDRREPIIVRSLLMQVEGVEKLTIDRLFAAGLHRLEALLRASGEEIASVAGVRIEVARAIADRFRGHRAQSGAALSAPDTVAAKNEVRKLVTALRAHHQAFEDASNQWTEDATERRRATRKDRDLAYQQIKVALARLGEGERVEPLESLPFARRLEALEALVDKWAKS